MNLRQPYIDACAGLGLDPITTALGVKCRDPERVAQVDAVLRSMMDAGASAKALRGFFHMGRSLVFARVRRLAATKRGGGE